MFIRYKAKEVYYNRRPVRIINVEGEHWWVMRDVTEILGYKNIYVALKLLKSSENRCVVVSCSKFSARMYIINESGLKKIINNASVPEAEDFRRWVEYGVALDKEESQTAEQVKVNLKKNIPVDTDMKNKSSIEVALQKAAIFVRMAEHKAVPQDEQRRLIGLALKELTGSGLKNSDVTASIDNKIKTITAEEKPVEAIVSNIMDLPEVVGVICKRRCFRIDGGCKIYLPGVRELSLKLGISIKDFDDFANMTGLKKRGFGTWVKVNTPEGEAREFAYISAVRDIFHIYYNSTKNGLPAT